MLSKVFLKINKNKINKEQKDREKEIKLFNILFLIFIAFFIAESVFLILDFTVIEFNLSEHIFFFLCLDKLYLNLGFIGVLGIFFSYYCYKKYRNLFLILISWIIVSFAIGYILIIAEWIKNFNIAPIIISERSYLLMIYWFDRLWFYSIPPLCILASIGTIELVKRLKYHSIFNRNKYLTLFTKQFGVLSIIFLSISGIIITGVVYGNSNYRYAYAQINTLGWISDNIPIHSKVLVGDNFFMGVGINSINFFNHYFFDEIFKAEYNEIENIQLIEYLKQDNMKYLVINSFFISYYLNKSDFVYNILIPNFYNDTLYECKEEQVIGAITVYYAPYFN